MGSFFSSVPWSAKSHALTGFAENGNCRAPLRGSALFSQMAQGTFQSRVLTRIRGGRWPVSRKRAQSICGRAALARTAILITGPIYLGSGGAKFGLYLVHSPCFIV